MAFKFPTKLPPPGVKFVILEVLEQHVLLVTINRARQMNSLPHEACWEMDRVWKWFDEEETLRVGIITGAGKLAFSAGMDLKERASDEIATMPDYPPTGFAGLTKRVGKKPILAAVNGHCQGGGFEIALNCDIVYASTNANFSLPDVAVGTVALMGALSRLNRVFGLQRAMVLAIMGYSLSAEEAREWGLVWKVVEQTELLRETIKAARLIAGMSPDSVIVSRAGVREAWETGSVDKATQITRDRFASDLLGGQNVREGVTAFKEKRKPRWVSSKL